MNLRPTRVYFIRPIGMEGPVKIGVSHSPTGRRDTLETWSPFALEIIAELPGNRLLERKFHSFFRDTYQRREWFGWSDRMAETVAAINAGTFDPATLPEPTRLTACTKRKPWSEASKRSASYTHRLRIVRQRTGLIARNVDCSMAWRFCQNGDEASLALIEEFIADPVTHGCTWAEKFPEEAARAERNKAEWLARQADRIAA